MPAYYDFEEWELKDSDLQANGLWLLNFKETIPPWRPLNLYSWQIQCKHGLEYGAEVTSMPGSHSWDLRQKDGYEYMAIMMTTEDEKKQREPVFRQRMVPWIEDFAKEYNRGTEEMKRRYEQHKQVNVEALSDIDLQQEWEQAWRLVHRMWELHMEAMMPSYCIYALFIDELNELLGVEGMDPRVKSLMSGFDNTVFRQAEEQWRLARMAIDLKLGGLFETLAEDQLLAELEQKDAGRKWLEEYRKFLWEYGWRNQRRADCSTATWIEKPSLGLADIKLALSQGGVSILVEERERLVKERQEVEKEFISSKVPDARREMFGKLMKGAQLCGWWSEDHGYWYDMYAYAMLRRATIEIGKRFSQTGVTNDPEDIFFLLPSDIFKAAIARRYSPMYRLVEIRKKAWEENLKIDPPPFIGNFDLLGEWVVADPSFRIAAAPPVVRPELKADLYGAGSALGIVEGTARVIITVDRISELQPGEILVTPLTTAAWVPAFGVAKAVVTDGGGDLSHAVIVAREYGIPAVAGCMEATKKIKTGDRIRVDGNNLAVYILGS